MALSILSFSSVYAGERGDFMETIIVGMCNGEGGFICCFKAPVPIEMVEVCEFVVYYFMEHIDE